MENIFLSRMKAHLSQTLLIGILCLLLMVFYSAALSASGSPEKDYYLMVASSHHEVEGVVTGDPGETVDVPIYLTSDGRVAGLQFDLHFNEDLLIPEIVEKGDLTAAFSLSTNLTMANRPPGMLRIIIWVFGEALIEEGTGSVVNIKFQANDTASSGDSTPLHLDTVRLSDQNAQPLGPVGLRHGTFLIPPLETEHTVTFGVTAGDGDISATADDEPISSGTQVAEGSEVIFTALPAAGSRVKDWIVDGEPLGSTEHTYTIAALQAAVDVEVEFEIRDEGTGTISHVVLEIDEDLVIFTIGTYGSSLAHGPGHKTYDYMAPTGAPVVRAVRSGNKFMGIGAYGAAYAQEGDTVRAIAAAPGQDEKVISSYLVFLGFDTDDNPILEPFSL